MNEIISIKEMMEEAISKSGILRISMIKGAWKSITGDLAIKSEPLGIKDAILYTAVENSVYLHAMTMKKDIYIDRINKLLKDIYVVDIKYRVRKIDIEAKLKRGEGVIIPEETKKEKIEYKTKDMTIEESVKYLAKLAKQKEKYLFENGYTRCKKCGDIFLGKEKLCSKCRGEKENLTINKY